jgi:hypothetical protein
MGRFAFQAALAALAAVAAPAALLTEPTTVSDCRPCNIDAGGKAGRWAATFDIGDVDGERIIRAVRLRNEQSKELTLPVSKMTPVPAGDKFVFGPQDINFDGCQDLMLTVDAGVANEYAVYWIWEAQRSTYVPAGRYPVFQLDPQKKRLTTFERGGYGGRIYEKNEYTFQSGIKPLLVRSEKQTLLRAPDRFRRTVSERVNGRMRVVRQRTVSGSELMDGSKPAR